LLSIAIFDDLGAMALIAIFYKSSSIHPTLWGFIIGFSLPLIKKLGSPPLQSDLRFYLEKFQSMIHSVVQWIILPLFAFVSSGIIFGQTSCNDYLHPIVMGISLGLLLGKPLGITGFSYLLIRLGWASLPSGSQLKHVGICSVFAGIGFTMSLFMGLLAFDNTYQQSLVKIGILSGSLGCILFAITATVSLKALRPRS
jgi:NhaA family Na+:H+ antiporter